ncbi:MAG: stage II sporulation protein P [Gorillibacterium sp.]|nr:stage II sporulation protein P [Gorillibacterium sp.]
MKWISFTLDISKIRRVWQHLFAMMRTFGALSLYTFLLFILLGLAGYANEKLDRAPLSPMKGWAASISNAFFIDAMGLEIPHLQKDPKTSVFSEANIFGFAFRLLTDINLNDPRTFLAREVPGLASDKTVLLRKSASGVDSGGPDDYTPIHAKGDPKGTAPSPNTTLPSDNPGVSPTTNNTNGTDSTTKPSATEGSINNLEKVVMIYHSHNRESYLPNLKNVTDPDNAYDDKENVTLVGKRLAAQLEKLGVGAVNYSTDYTSVIKHFNYAFAYKYSNKTVQEAFITYPAVDFVFDIHRDSLSRNKTTIEIGGKAYAQVFFIIGQRNPHWKENEAFAAKIHDALEIKTPGLSRGIWGKTPQEGNAEYNQTLSSNSVLLEIGGPYNSLEECYRTADVLAKVIADIYHNAQKANASQAAAKR